MNSKGNLDLLVIFNAQVSGKSMGGGDKIVLKTVKGLNKRFNVAFAGCSEGEEMALHELTDSHFIHLGKFEFKRLGLLLSYISRIVTSPYFIFKSVPSGVASIWSASDFLPDTLPAIVYKLRNRSTKWIMSMFLKARNPFKKEVPLNINTFLFFLSQRISLLFAKYLAHTILVLSIDDILFLTGLGINKEKIQKFSGGVDIEEIKAVSNKTTQYDAVFVGRFHYQKGIEDLVYVWKKVSDFQTNAKLAVIGWGEIDIKKLFDQAGVPEKNYKILGFLDGIDKYKVMRSSNVLLFPSSFESWGVVIAEGIASDLPVVCYDIPVVKENFTHGVKSVPSFDRDKFSDATISLLQNPQERKRIVEEAVEFSKTLGWEFDVQLLTSIISS